MRKATVGRARSWLILAAASALVLLISFAVVSNLYYLREKSLVEQGVGGGLRSGTLARSQRIADWYAVWLERTELAARLAERRFTELSATSLHPQPEEPFKALLDTLRREYRFDEMLIADHLGRVLASAPTGFPGQEAKVSLGHILEAARTKRVVLQDFHWGGDTTLRLAWYVPLSRGPHLLGQPLVLIAAVHPAPFLASIFPQNPTPLMVEVFLQSDNGLRLGAIPGADQSSGHSSVRFEIRPAEVAQNPPPAGGAAYWSTPEGKRVLGVRCRVAGTPWTLVAQTDEKSLYAPTRRIATAVGAAAGIFALGFFLLAVLLLRHRDARAQLALAEAELERTRALCKYESLIRQAGDAVIWTTLDGNIKEVNEVACKLTACTRDQLLSRNISEVLQLRNGSAGGFQELKQLEGRVLQALCRGPENRLVPVELNMSLARTPEGEQMLLWIARDTTQREASEAALREAEARLRTALVLAGVTLSHQDTTLRYTWCSGPRGFDCPEQITGLLDEDLFGPEQGRALRALKMRVLQTGVGTRAEVRRPSQSGEKWYEVLIQVEKDETGKPNGVVSAWVDVTELKLARELARRLEEEHRLLVEQIPGIVYTRSLGPDYPWHYVSPQIEPLLGYTPSEWLWELNGETNRYVYEEDREVLRSALEACAHKSELAVVDYRIVARDGTVKWFRDHLRLVPQGRGQQAYIQGLLIDITDRKKAQAEVRRLLEGLEHAPISIVVTDETGLITYANQEFVKRNLRAGVGTVGLNLAELKPEWCSLLAHGPLPQPGTKGYLIQRDLQGCDPEGRTRWERVTVARPLTPAGDPGMLLFFAQDVTREKLVETQVQHWQKMEALGRLAAGVAHDFNNILSIVAGYTGLLAENVFEEDPKAPLLREISKATDRGRQLTQRLLNFARSYSTKREPVDLNQVIRDALPLLEPLLGKHVSIHLDLESDLPLVELEEGQLEQILLNLAANSKDAMPEGGKFSIATRKIKAGDPLPRGSLFLLAPPGSCVELRVSDTGSGIPQDVLPHIFEPFFTTKQGKGTGLGLPTVYSIIRQAGGGIWVASRPGAGTLFTIRFPVAQHSDSRT